MRFVKCFEIFVASYVFASINHTCLDNFKLFKSTTQQLDAGKPREKFSASDVTAPNPEAPTLYGFWPKLEVQFQAFDDENEAKKGLEKNPLYC